MYDYDKNKSYCNDYKLEYARSYIVLQSYRNLFSIKDASRKGTIFSDLYRPYNEYEETIC